MGMLPIIVLFCMSQMVTAPVVVSWKPSLSVHLDEFNRPPSQAWRHRMSA